MSLSPAGFKWQVLGRWSGSSPEPLWTSFFFKSKGRISNSYFILLRNQIESRRVSGGIKTYKLSKWCIQTWYFVQEQAIDFVFGQEIWTIVPINCIKQYIYMYIYIYISFLKRRDNLTPLGRDVEKLWEIVMTIPW